MEREITRLYYDGQGRRLAKEYDPKTGAAAPSPASGEGRGGGLKRTEYVFDNLDPVVEYALWNGQHTEYYRGEGAQLLTMRHFPAGAEGQSYWYHLDGRGSVAGLTKHEGQSTHNYRYDAYGQLLPARGNWTDPHNHYTFSGKEWDAHLDSYEFGYRLYDPTAGVWLTRDPLRGEPQRPRTLHRYQYAFASPISYRDPYGLQVRPPKCEPGEICHTGTTGPYNVRSPSASAPTGALEADCYSPLTPELWELSLRYAGRYGIPVELLAGTVAVEIEHDTDWWDPMIDQFLLASINCAEACLTEAGNLSGLALFGWDYLTGRGPGPGVANFHTETARDVEEYYRRYYADRPELQLPYSEEGTYPETSYRRIEYLASDEGNVHYTAAYLRMLADYREGEGGLPSTHEHLKDLSDTDMAIIKGAYRAGIERGWGRVENFQQASQPGELGSLILPYLEQYRQLGREE